MTSALTPATATAAHLPEQAIPSGPAGMDGIARLAARVAGATTAAVLVGNGRDRRVVAVAGSEHVQVYGSDAAAPSASVPLVGPDGVLRGSLEVFGDREPDDATRELLHDLAAQGVALLELHRATSELVRTAGRDGLTGLPNRRSVEQAIASAISRAERGLGMPSLVVVDLNGFAALNDSLGTAVGDAVLRSVADRLVRTARTVDTVGRIGADEFAVVLEHTGGPGAVAALQRFRRALDPSANDPREVADEVAVTVSLGITTYRPGDSVASLLARADAEMFADRAHRG